MKKGGGEGELGEGKQRHGKDGEGGHEDGMGEMVGGTWGCGGEDVVANKGLMGVHMVRMGIGVGGEKYEGAHDENAEGET